MMKPKWVKVHNKESGSPYALECERCGSMLYPPLKVKKYEYTGDYAIDYFIVFTEFCEEHSKCGEVE